MVIRYATLLLTLTDVLALILGLLFWTGNALHLISMHMLLGIIAVVALWVGGFAQALGGGSWPLAIIAFIIGLATLFLGIHQMTLMVGPNHWIIEVVHLILGLLTIGFGHMCAKRNAKSKMKN